MALEFLEGALKLTNLVLALVAGYLSVRIYSMSRRKDLLPWKILAVALLFFMVQQILGALRAFGLYTSPFLTHIVPTIILGLLILALSLQIHYTLTRR
ncbi:hypothetical protein J4419_05515 [Candidatus Woesearchaeota archaeon]|nr:hypothetical protein [Candidatus Woesearchaeota archaeon]